MTEQDTLIQCVNKLHDAFTHLGVNAQFDLPQIAVVGSQSAGKSSVLENLVGWDFLPRGTGIVTRCPLILQMMIGPEKYGEFSHSEKKFTDYAEIRAEIEERTKQLTGDNEGKEISKYPINLKIFSPDFLNLTLVDLPGLTKNPIGNQPEDIEWQLEELIVEYIEKDSCLILAVSPANIDLANSEALKLARKVDQENKRTIGVVTKLDLMDAGTDARDVFLGKTFPLPRGYVGVVCRSQSDIDRNKGIIEALQKEEEFFENHPKYKDLTHRMGTKFLQRKLNCDLAKHIREKLPRFRDEILAKKKKAEYTLRDLPKCELKNGGFNELHKIVNDLDAKITKCVKGTTGEISKKQQIGMKIHSIFHEGLENDYWDKEVDEQEIYNDITKTIQNMRGIQPNLYAADEVLIHVARNQIMVKRDAMEKCLQKVIRELHNFFIAIVNEIVASTFPPLAVEVRDVILRELSSCEEECGAQLDAMIREESSYINIKHVDFVNCNQLSHSDILQTGILVDNEKTDYWAALSSNILQIYSVPLDDDEPKSLIIDKVFAVKDRFHLQQKGHDGYHNLSPKQPMQFNAWKYAFITAGVLDANVKHGSYVDFSTETQILQIRKHLGFYMRIFTKKYLDTVPKKITWHVVEKMVDYVKEDLFDDLATGNLINLLQENPQQKEKREKASAELEVCKKALQIIDEQDAMLAFD